MTLSQQQGSLSNFVSTWTETNTGSAGGTATATHSGETGVSHYLCGLIVSCKETTASSTPITVTCNVKDDSTAIISFGFTSASTDDYDTNGNPAAINFTNPIKITVGEDLTVELTGAAMTTTSSVSFWGFTDL